MGKKSHQNRKSEIDKSVKLEQALRERDGRILLEDAAALIEVDPTWLRNSCRALKCAIGLEDRQEFLVSIARDLRLLVISNFLKRNPDKRVSHVNLKTLVGVPADSTLLDKVIPDDHPNICRQRGEYWWVDDGAQTEKFLSVASAARGLLYHHGIFERYFNEASDRVKAKLRRIWGRTELVIAIDGGRTNHAVVKELVKERLPSGSVRMVTYITNYKLVEQAVFDRRESNLHDPVLIGGRMREHSKTYVGRFAEACWHAYNITPDIAFVATSTVSDSGQFGTSDFEESRFKSLMLGGARTTLRCITSDSTKIQSLKGGGWTFASLEDIDVVVTDHDVLVNGREFLNHARTFGVLVVMDNPPAQLLTDHHL